MVEVGVAVVGKVEMSSAEDFYRGGLTTRCDPVVTTVGVDLDVPSVSSTSWC